MEDAMENSNVRHVLVIRFREDATEAQLQTFFTKFRDMAGKVEGVTGFEYGANNSREGMDRGLTHVVMVTFANLQARDAYLPHPEHRKFVEWLGQVKLIEELLVVDYTAHK
jgi:hypothetical protein